MTLCFRVQPTRTFTPTSGRSVRKPIKLHDHPGRTKRNDKKACACNSHSRQPLPAKGILLLVQRHQLLVKLNSALVQINTGGDGGGILLLSLDDELLPLGEDLNLVFALSSGLGHLAAVQKQIVGVDGADDVGDLLVAEMRQVQRVAVERGDCIENLRSPGRFQVSEEHSGRVLDRPNSQK